MESNLAGRGSETHAPQHITIINKTHGNKNHPDADFYRVRIRETCIWNKIINPEEGDSMFIRNAGRFNQ